MLGIPFFKTKDGSEAVLGQLKDSADLKRRLVSMPKDVPGYSTSTYAISDKVEKLYSRVEELRALHEAIIAEKKRID